MKIHYTYISTICIALIMAVWLFPECFVLAQDQKSTTSPTPPGFSTRADYLKSLTSEKKILNAYHAGLVSKDEAAQALAALGDKASMDIYGKVVDQYGQPIAGAKVRGDLEFNLADDEERDTTTDAQGRFHFLGLHGTGLSIFPEKKGYDYNVKFPTSRPGLYVPDPNNPVIVTMWKLRGAEPMVHTQIYSDVPCDGTVKRFDLLSNRQHNSGDVIVKLTRNPLNIDRRYHFNWSVTLAITNGGLQEITNLAYPYEAPADGYQPLISFNFSTNAVDWRNQINNSYYFRNNDGRIYGRIEIHIRADRSEPPTYFYAEIYSNTNGSRNLEYDPKKEIRNNN